MSRRHVIGPTSAPHYPAACVGGWIALGAQEAMENARCEWPELARLLIGGHAASAALFWSIAERQGLVVQ